MTRIQEEEEENDSKLSISENSKIARSHTFNTKKLKTKKIRVTLIELGD